MKTLQRMMEQDSIHQTIKPIDHENKVRPKMYGYFIDHNHADRKAMSGSNG